MPAWLREIEDSWGWLAPEADEYDDLVTIRLARLGRSFTERVAELTERQRAELLGLLDRVLAGDDPVGRDAVATGFLEAVLSAWDGGFDLRPVWPHVGPHAREYCLAWNDFTGVPSPDWMR
ncbi:hypothetical protein ALI22I_09140 [Saccharothrix sp. ALI-22-I]|uniref:hypothetical protein n=1 Tax=Saccharothrix sp. ALI-22-I TaxID=1933778 RepID=UPI00097C1F7D|nr:hypothetical protein [Saccharothrix sp. ALI-22-I]ONI91230.1 hypothetical protein ALI22I_09140 [Saccharothrix sp. ALI-22-I]